MLSEDQQCLKKFESLDGLDRPTPVVRYVYQATGMIKRSKVFSKPTVLVKLRGNHALNIFLG